MGFWRVSETFDAGSPKIPPNLSARAAAYRLRAIAAKTGGLDAAIVEHWTQLADQTERASVTADKGWFRAVLEPLGDEAAVFGDTLERMGFDLAIYRAENADLDGLDDAAMVREFYDGGVRERRPVAYKLSLEALRSLLRDSNLPDSLKRDLAWSAALSRVQCREDHDRDEGRLAESLSPSDWYNPLLVFGDGNAAFYDNPEPLHQAELLCVPFICPAGSGRGLGDCGSQTSCGGLILALLERHAARIAEAGAFVLFRFGQVDLEAICNPIREQAGRVHFNYHRAHASMIATCDAYFSYLERTRALLTAETPFAVASVFPLASNEAGLHGAGVKVFAEKSCANKAHQPADSLETRIAESETPDLELRAFFHHLFNLELKARCKAMGWPFLDDAALLVSADGELETAYTKFGTDHLIDFGAAATQAHSGRMARTLRDAFELNVEEKAH